MEYYTNQQEDILIEYDKKDNSYIFTNGQDFGSYETEEGKSYEDFFEELKKEKKIKKCKTVLTTKDNYGYKRKKEGKRFINIFNEFKNANIFSEALKKLEYKDNKKNLYKLAKEKTPYFLFLLENLFYNEDKEQIENFLKWLSYVFYEENRQDIAYLFKGTNKMEQGQGAGKGVLIQILDKLLSGLTTNVNNVNYKDNFNSDLQNKKIVIFDELDVNKVDYNYLKYITGNDSIKIEYKGKNKINVKNYASWLFFTNESDIIRNMVEDDRRLFIIHPNPTNGSLEHITKTNNISISKLIENINEEFEEIVKIMAYINFKKLYPKKPQDLRSKAHKHTFEKKKSIKNIDNILEIFIDKKTRLNFCKNLEELTINGDLNINKKHFIYFLENGIYTKNLVKWVIRVLGQLEIGNIRNKAHIMEIATLDTLEQLKTIKGYETKEIKGKYKSLIQHKYKDFSKYATYLKKDIKSIKALLRVNYIELEEELLKKWGIDKRTKTFEYMKKNNIEITTEGYYSLTLFDTEEIKNMEEFENEINTFYLESDIYKDFIFSKYVKEELKKGNKAMLQAKEDIEEYEKEQEKKGKNEEKNEEIPF